jgi:hypothetical protein
MLENRKVEESFFWNHLKPLIQTPNLRNWWTHLMLRMKHRGKDGTPKGMTQLNVYFIFVVVVENNFKDFFW